MDGPPTPAPVVRDMVPGDLEQIIGIDIKVLGKPRPDYWQMKVQQVAGNPQFCGLVAELEGQVAGFIIGGVSRWEYGMPANIGWIDTIGVDPDRQRRGLAKVLFGAMAQRLKQMGVTSINTFVTKRDWKMLKFFQSLGFQLGDMTSLELEL